MKLFLRVQRLFLSLCLTAAALHTAYAQEQRNVRIIGIEEMFSLAEDANKSLKTSKTAQEYAAQEVKVAQSHYLPDIDMQLSASYIGNGMMCDRDFTNAAVAPMPHFGNNFALKASQVIYAGGEISAGVSIARLSHQIAALSTEQNRKDMKFLLVGQYLDLYKMYNQERIYEQNILLTRKLIDNVRAKQAQGTALKNDITRYELQLEDLLLALTRVRNECDILNYKLCNALGISTDTHIIPDTSILTATYPAGSPTEWQQSALTASAPLQQAAKGIDIAREKLRLERAAMIPHISLQVAGSLDGPILIEVPPINKNFAYWYVGVGINFNIGALYKNNKNVQRSKIAIRQSHDEYDRLAEQVDNAIHADYIYYRQAFVELRTQQKSVELANQNYTIVNNRYLNDLALVTDMLDAANTKLSAELLEANARINIVYAYYKLKYTAGTL